jgi:hypothetical protein
MKEAAIANLKLPRMILVSEYWKEVGHSHREIDLRGDRPVYPSSTDSINVPMKCLTIARFLRSQ